MFVLAQKKQSGMQLIQPVNEHANFNLAVAAAKDIVKDNPNEVFVLEIHSIVKSKLETSVNKLQLAEA